MTGNLATLIALGVIFTVVIMLTVQPFDAAREEWGVWLDRVK